MFLQNSWFKAPFIAFMDWYENIWLSKRFAWRWPLSVMICKSITKKLSNSHCLYVNYLQFFAGGGRQRFDGHHFYFSLLPLLRFNHYIHITIYIDVCCLCLSATLFWDISSFGRTQASHVCEASSNLACSIFRLNSISQSTVNTVVCSN